MRQSVSLSSADAPLNAVDCSADSAPKDGLPAKGTEGRTFASQNLLVMCACRWSPLTLLDAVHGHDGIQKDTQPGNLLICIHGGS